MKRKKWPFNIHDVILVLGLVGVAALIYCAASYSVEHNTMPDPSYIRCGMCNAHVTEWWPVRNEDDTAFIDVCCKCYGIVQNNTKNI